MKLKSISRFTARQQWAGGERIGNEGSSKPDWAPAPGPGNFPLVPAKLCRITYLTGDRQPRPHHSKAGVTKVPWFLHIPMTYVNG